VIQLDQAPDKITILVADLGGRGTLEQAPLLSFQGDIIP
jgi:hypothetical protein